MGSLKTQQDGENPAASRENVFAELLEPGRLRLVVGFALCQTWNVLCVALPKPVTYGEPFLDLRWLSMFTAAVVSLALLLGRSRFERVVGSRGFYTVLACVSCACTALGPVSALFPGAAAALLRLAAVGIGVGFAGLFATWYVVFCRSGDMLGVAASVVLSAVLAYPLANVLSSDQVSPWVATFVGALLPIVSLVVLTPSLGEGSGGESGAPAPVPAQFSPEGKALVVRFTVCLFAVTCVIEVARNLLLGGTAITFYAGVVNLGSLCLKVAGAVWLLRVFAQREAGYVSVAFRLTYMLLLGVVLCTPMLLQGDWFAHTLLDTSSFFYQLVMLIVAFQIVEAFGVSPLAVFCGARLAWALAVAAGVGISSLMGEFDQVFTQRMTVAMGLVLAFCFAFAFRDADCAKILERLPHEERQPHFKSRCADVARLGGLSERELEVMLRVAKGRSSSRIAEEMGISLATVNTHVHHVYRKLGIHSRQELLDLVDAG